MLVSKLYGIRCGLHLFSFCPKEVALLVVGLSGSRAVLIGIYRKGIFRGTLHGGVERIVAVEVSGSGFVCPIELIVGCPTCPIVFKLHVVRTVALHHEFTGCAIGVIVNDKESDGIVLHKTIVGGTCGNTLHGIFGTDIDGHVIIQA